MSDYMTAGTCGRAAPEGGWWALVFAMFVEGCAHTRTDSEGLQTADGWLAGNGGRAGKQASEQATYAQPSTGMGGCKACNGGCRRLPVRHLRAAHEQSEQRLGWA